MAAWRPAQSLDVLLAQVNAAAPNRDKSSDGTLASTAHHAANPNSDHEADPLGVVHARDITNDPAHGCDSKAIAHSIVASHDQRVKYVISDRQIASGSGQSHEAWLWRPYSGSNPHTEHCHVSVKAEPALADSLSPWQIGTMTPDPSHPPVLGRPELAYGAIGPDVKVIQAAIMVDGYFGPLTQASVKAFQRDHGLTQDGIVGPYTWAALGLANPPAPAPVPPGPAPSPTDPGWFTGITATVFGGPDEDERSAYDGHRIDDAELAVALPFRFSGTRPKVEVSNAAGKSVIASIEDVGPWLTDDPYWDLGQRPLAEAGLITRGPNKGRTSNKAGIDLSPALARALGIDGKGQVDWRFVTPSRTSAPLLPAAPEPLPLPQQEQPRSTLMNDQIWTMVRYAMVGGGMFLASYGYFKPEDVPGLVDQVLPAIQGLATSIGAGVTAVGAIWGLYVGWKTKRVAVDDLPAKAKVVNPMSGAIEQLAPKRKV